VLEPVRVPVRVPAPHKQAHYRLALLEQEQLEQVLVLV
jgi:hypothetical protein